MEVCDDEKDEHSLLISLGGGGGRGGALLVGWAEAMSKEFKILLPCTYTGYITLTRNPVEG